MIRHHCALALGLLASALCAQDHKRLFGLVRDFDGAPVEGAQVDISIVPDLAGVRVVSTSFQRATTDKLGRFGIEGRVGELYVVWAHRDSEDGGGEDYDATRLMEAVPGTPVVLDLAAHHHRPVIKCAGAEAWAPRTISRIGVRVPRLAVLTNLTPDEPRAPYVPADEPARILVYDEVGFLLAPLRFDATESSGEVRLPRPVAHLFRAQPAAGGELTGWIAVLVDDSMDTLATIQVGDNIVRLPDDEALLRRNRVLFPAHAAGCLEPVDALAEDDEAGRRIVAEGGRVWQGNLAAGSTLTGRLLLNGEPLVGIALGATSQSITYRDQDRFVLAETPQWAFTDEEGRFFIPSLRFGCGPRVVAAVPPELEPRLPEAWRGRLPRAFVVCFATGGGRWIQLGDMELTRSHWLADVRMSTHEGLPAMEADAWITAQGFTGHAERLHPAAVDRGGRFSALVPSGAVTFVGQLDDAWAVQCMAISEPPPASVFPIEIVLDPPQVLVIRIVDERGEPVAGAEVTSWLDWDTEFELKRPPPTPVVVAGGRLTGAPLHPQRLCQMFSSLLPRGRRSDARGELRLPIPYGRGALQIGVLVDGREVASRKVEFDGPPAEEIVIRLD